MPSGFQTAVEYGLLASAFNTAITSSIHLPWSGRDSNGAIYFVAGSSAPTNGSPIYALASDGTVVKATWTGRVIF